MADMDVNDAAPQMEIDAKVDENESIKSDIQKDDEDMIESESVDEETKIADEDEPTTKSTTNTKLVKAQKVYFHYMAANRAQVTKDNPGIGYGQISKLLTKQWNELPSEEKELYNTKAAEDKERYLREKQALLEQGIDIDDLSSNKKSTDDSNTLVLPLARVKRILLTDPEVQKISKDATIAIAKATEQFIQYLAAKSYDSAAISKRKTIKDSDIIQAIHAQNVLDWLRDDFPEKAQLKQVTKSSSRPATSEKPAAQRITSYFTRGD